MNRSRIGDLLRRHVPLSTHDVDEILHEQLQTRKRFGDVALALGLCSPEDVWRAWMDQLSDRPERVDLARIGIDSQAVSAVSPELAREFGVVPLRIDHGRLLLATAEENLCHARGISSHIQRRVKFVVAPAPQINAALHRYYPVGVCATH